MKNLTSILVVAGCLFILAAVVIKFIILPSGLCAALYVKPSSLLILANTSFILAVLFKK